MQRVQCKQCKRKMHWANESACYSCIGRMPRDGAAKLASQLGALTDAFRAEYISTKDPRILAAGKLLKKALAEMS